MTDDRMLPRHLRPPRFAATKFIAPPPVAGAARRDALHGRLDATADLPVTIVVGAVGSGKTALLSQWFHDQALATSTWVSADRGDADPVRFWRGLIAAVQQLDPTFGVEASDIITLDGEVSADALESLLVDESLLDRRISIVVDDTHLVSSDALAQLGHIIDRRPANLRLILGSRVDPAIGLARLRLNGRVAEIRDTDLRFDAREISVMLERFGLDLRPIDVDDLLERTEGWAAGVQFAALSVLGAPDAGERLRSLTGTHTVIASYLLDEVLANQPPHLRRFLEDTCVVDELDAEMCEALIVDGEGGGATTPVILLREVESANLFLTRVEPAGTIFRYHQLFADLLRDELRTRDPQRFRRQHARAADVYLTAGDPVRAVSHLWRSGDRDRAAHLIAQNPLSVYLTGSTPPPVDLLDYITDEDVLSDIPLVGGYALALLLNARPREAGDLVARVDRIIGLDKVPSAERLILVSLRGGAQMLVGDTAAATRSLSAVIDAVERGETASEEWLAVSIPVGVRAAAWEGDFALAERIASHFRPVHVPHLESVDMVAAMAMVHYVRGHIRLAIDTARSAAAAAASLGVVGSGSELAAQAVLAAALVDSGDLATAEVHVARVLDSARVERLPSLVLATFARARLLRARGEYEGALGAIAVARSRVIDAPSTLSNLLDHAEFIVSGTLRDNRRVDEIMPRIIDPLLAGRMAAWSELMHGRLTAAAARAERLSDLAQTPRQRFELEVLLARIDFDSGSDHVAERAAKLVDLAEESGMLLHVAEGGTAVLEEVRREARLRVRSDVTDGFLRLQPLPRPANRLQPHHPHDELSAREQIVLRYMATSMSNQEIAATLYLSVNTVKTHIKNILRKMQAVSRHEAVERARQLSYL